MKCPNENQIDGAVAIMRQHITQYGSTASDTRIRSTVYSMGAALGGPGQPAEEFADAVRVATSGDTSPLPMIRRNPADGSFTVLTENPLGLKIGTVFAPLDLDDEADDDEYFEIGFDETADNIFADKGAKGNEIIDLSSLKKAELLKAAFDENTTGVDDSMTKAQIIEQINAARVDND